MKKPVSRRSEKGRKSANGELTGDRLAALSRADHTRLRAAWMYYIENMTQSDIADVLGIGRVTVVRMLAEARQRNEVRITIEGELVETVKLERELEKRFGLERAIVAPVSDASVNVIPAIGAATGRYLSEMVESDLRVGVGWGRTLLSCLPYITPRPLENLQVISLLGGIIHARRFNPAEFAWQFAQAFRGNAYLIPAPALVDSAETRQALIERCGLKDIFDKAAELDIVVLSVGGLAPATTTTHQVGFITEAQLMSLQESGAVGDILFHFIDQKGRIVDHPINELVMSVGLDRLRLGKWRILTSGGADKTGALLGAIAVIEPHVLITDEFSARRLLDAAD
ncbi:sugar-binding transcriptional regulator [Chelativorans sp. Marseille-P2723]|uniref:sugar-binding transcriptional regulator n=1 Tax=Chelativorans sp. Marseille-P2723 TaxID=2709133 RepID=UPI001FF0192F|nr:sugar-binding transcriptional regulator [Chelativorans sp. Marseille-P2723]